MAKTAHQKLRRTCTNQAVGEMAQNKKAVWTLAVVRCMSGMHLKEYFSLIRKCSVELEVSRAGPPYPRERMSGWSDIRTVS